MGTLSVIDSVALFRALPSTPTSLSLGPRKRPPAVSGVRVPWLEFVVDAEGGVLGSSTIGRKASSLSCRVLEMYSPRTSTSTFCWTSAHILGGEAWGSSDILSCLSNSVGIAPAPGTLETVN
eukprot:scaffold2364_cov426-Prasinococcus_capsulatus_cf.AAC.5